jgi:adenylosuccinate synthase
MPVATLKFNLPEEKYKYNQANKASEYYCALWDIDQRLRGIIKYGEEKKDVNELAQEIRELGGEYGAVTGRPRRIAWLDLGMLAKACQINGVTHLAITKMDIAGKMPLVVKDANGAEFRFNGWDSIDHPEAVRFVQLLQQTVEQASGATIGLLGIGPNTTDIVALNEQFMSR